MSEHALEPPPAPLLIIIPYARISLFMADFWKILTSLAIVDLIDGGLPGSVFIFAARSFP